ncbi:MAG: S9 family peptidase [Sphingomonas sp.]|jgi:dipeptidyl aminopeptidase/acylaminoacyl peptidase|uniref:alpha/beta hydrolase family protein n=1 Tax=Sphingomonas sp. TaxID=28214 RepID=UPI00356490C2
MTILQRYWRALALGGALCGSFVSAQTPAPAPTSTPVPAPTPAEIPAEAFATLPFLQGPELSPDGTRVAVKLAINGQQRFAIVSLDAPDKVVQVDPGPNDLNSWAWVNNDWLVATVGTTAPVEGDSWYLRRTLGISADGKKINILGRDLAAQSADDILWIARDGRPHVLIALQTSIYSDHVGFWPEVRDFDVTTGKNVRVQSSAENVFNWYADPAGTVRYGIAYDDDVRSYRLLYRDTAAQSFRTVSRARGKDADLGNTPAMFLPEPGKALAYDDAEDVTALYPLDLATLKTGPKLFGVPGYDIDSILTTDGGTRLAGVRYTDTRLRTHWIDPVLADVQTKVDAAIGTRVAHIVSWSSDFKVLILQVGGADRPGAYYLYRPAEGVMHLIAMVNDTLGLKAYAPVRTIKYKARDGLEISAVLTLPRGKDPKNLPLILLPHGGPYARDDESWDWWTQFLASRGYAVLQPNYRGSSGFGKAFTNKGRGQWGLAMQDDLTDAVKWAADSGIADAKRVCIIGGSYGGYAAFRAAQRDGAVYRCAVSYAGVSDMPAMLRYDGAFLNGGRSKDYLRDQAPDLKGVSPIYGAAQFSMPILIMHGKKDTVVPVKQSREMAAKLKAAGKPYVYIEQPLGDHHFTRQADRLEFLKAMEAFLKEHNPA